MLQLQLLLPQCQNVKPWLQKRSQLSVPIGLTTIQCRSIECTVSRTISLAKVLKRTRDVDVLFNKIYASFNISVRDLDINTLITGEAMSNSVNKMDSNDARNYNYQNALRVATHVT